ncbi:hypothetical protein [Poseidonibacter lekithochrous]|uniref:hypothetical protein n=1 Tax=Poseidonibacter lekithochrous TaxID=1904463 RepID=UPI000D332B9F|nr:hypothetical protein [Poseidonibacter lekithochrous]
MMYLGLPPYILLTILAIIMIKQIIRLGKEAYELKDLIKKSKFDYQMKELEVESKRIDNERKKIDLQKELSLINKSKKHKKYIK